MNYADLNGKDVTLRFPSGEEWSGTIRQSDVQAVAVFPGHGRRADVEILLTPEQRESVEEQAKRQTQIVLHSVLLPHEMPGNPCRD